MVTAKKQFKLLNILIILALYFRLSCIGLPYASSYRLSNKAYVYLNWLKISVAALFIKYDL